MGAVGSEGMTDITALGDNVNVAARLASAASAGEIIASEETCLAAGLDTSSLARRVLQLKGRSQKVAVRVLNA